MSAESLACPLTDGSPGRKWEAAVTFSTLACHTPVVAVLEEAHSLAGSYSVVVHSLGCSSVAELLAVAHIAGYTLHSAVGHSLDLAARCSSHRPGRGELLPLCAIEISEIDRQTRRDDRVGWLTKDSQAGEGEVKLLD